MDNSSFIFCFMFNGKCLKCDDKINLEEADNELYDLWETRKQNSVKSIFEAQQMYGEIERRQQILSELRQSTRRFLQQENANLLAEILSANGSTIHLQKLNDVYDELKNNYDSLLMEDIFQEALEQVYRYKSPEELINDLYEVYKPPNDMKSFEMMVTLKGTAYNVYYYMMDSQANTIAGWQSTDKDPFNHIWTVQFINDKVALYQNDYIMCSVERYDGSRRNVNGYEFNGTEFNTNNPSCQWSVGNCDRGTPIKEEE
ncbi:hypothetical protein DOY81_008072 [Sarcophaga bullata]|nr:hypothetical protein DOY81_008072 [Sarcophaga bullata]